MMWGLGMGLGGILLVVLFVLAIAWVTRGGVAWQSTSGQSRDDPLRILDERYARGEIDEEEYRRRQDTLRR